MDWLLDKFARAAVILIAVAATYVAGCLLFGLTLTMIEVYDRFEAAQAAGQRCLVWSSR